MWYRKAADQGDAQAQYNLGIAYDQGNGVRHDVTEAFHWFLRAAERGHAEAQFNVAISYGQGNGIAENQVEGLKWLILSASGGYSKATEVRNVVGQQYSRSQVSEAERLATQWRSAKEG